MFSRSLEASALSDTGRGEACRTNKRHLPDADTSVGRKTEGTHDDSLTDES